MDDANHITREIQAEKEQEDLNIYDIGTRQLNDEQIQHLIYILNPILNGPVDYDLIKDTSIHVAQQLKKEDISYESALTLFGHLQIKVEYLREGYLSKEEIKLPLHELLTTHPSGSTIDKESAKKVSIELKETIKRPRHEGMIIGVLGTNRLVVIDPRTRTVNEERIKTVNGRDFSSSDIIIKAVPEKITVYDNPIANETRQFKCLWKSTLSPRPLPTGPSSASEIADELTASGYIINERRGKDILKSTFNAMIENNLVTMKSEVEAPGFYWNDIDSTITVVKYELPESVPEAELIQGLETFEEYAKWFKGTEDKLAHIFKWGLISPFIFAIKQRGGWVKWPFLYGNGGTGKTKGYGYPVLYMWGEPGNETNNLGGSSFNTEARIGDRLKQFTFPLLVSEPGGLFERKGPSELIKTAIEQITSRGKYMGKHYKTIPAYAPVIFTANQRFPDDDAFDRRLEPMLFTRSERRSDKEKEMFNSTFKIENTTTCRLHDLKAIANYVAIEIVNDPTLLDNDWKETTNSLLVRLYTELKREMPEWLLWWTKTETMEDQDSIQRERIRAFFQKEINEAYGKIQMIDEEGRPVQDYKGDFETLTTADFENRIWTVANSRKIPWLFLDTKGNIRISSTFMDDLTSRTCVKDSMQGIADLLGWQKLNSRAAGIEGTQIKINKNKFVQFVYPSCDENDEVCDTL